MKQWVCINNKGNEQELCINKVYNDLGSDFTDEFCILIKNDMGMVSEYYQPLRFVTIEEWRDLQLKKIGI